MARILHGLILAAGFVGGAAAQNQTGGQGLHALMVAAGKLYFGTAMETNNFNDMAYQAISSNRNEFGMFTPENSQKWEVTEPTQNQFSFTQADQVAMKVKSNGQLLRCHTLTWHSQLPGFVTTTTWTRATLTAALTAHITNVMKHYAGFCYAWDVVNEALNEDGSFRQSVFFKTLGPSYIPLSFSLAAAADPTAKLYYNDFNLETTAAKADGALKIVQLIQSPPQNITGARIDGVGFQAHLNVGQTPTRAQLAATLRRFTALGVEVAYTELDIAHTKLPASEADNQKQAADYVATVGSCLDVKECVGITVWQFSDKYSWVPGTFPGKGEACLYTEGFEKKVAYEAVVGLLRSTAGGSAGVGAGTGTGRGNATATGGLRGTGTASTSGVTEAAVPGAFSGAQRVRGAWMGLGVLPLAVGWVM
ncbi:glycoside hydrolase [Staphylotrichum tortipilum]|uniref:Beta-xylanase n=1 Tax=Staphylotrichum tortipilum TaxID=2831512 RepID=A0AAN6MTW0_9PEZI|nr:glycoside hydrolase [Staphylotrichum longicolle]